MRIGMAFMVDTDTFLPYFNKTDGDCLSACYPNIAPAVNTLALSFLRRGHFVRIFTIAKKSFIIKSKQLEIFAVEVYNKYPIKYLWGGFLNASNLRDLMKNNLEDLDVLHAHWTYDYAYAASYYEKQIPVFCTVRDWASYIWKIESNKNKITWTFRCLMNNLVFKHHYVHFIANSPYTAQRIKTKCGKDVPIIPNSIKDSFILKDERKEISQLRLLCISSSNDKRKNVRTLLLAFSLFRKKHPDAILQLIGAPFVEGDDVVEKWRLEGLLSGVELMGAQPHHKLASYIDSAILYITPSLEETFGNTLLESIVRKVPVIGGKDSGAIPYVLHQGKAGFLCDVSNPESMNEMMEYVCSNPSEVRAKCKEAYRIILNEYSESVVCDEHIQLYKNIRENS